MFKVWNLKGGRSFEEDFEKDFAVLINGKKKLKKNLSVGCQLIFLIVVQKQTQGHCPFPDDHIPGIWWGIWNLKYVFSI